MLIRPLPGIRYAVAIETDTFGACLGAEREQTAGRVAHLYAIDTDHELATVAFAAGFSGLGQGLALG